VRQLDFQIGATAQEQATRLELDYSAGLTTQLPAGRSLGVQKRVRRKIVYNGTYLSFERAGSTPR